MRFQASVQFLWLASSLLISVGFGGWWGCSQPQLSAQEPEKLGFLDFVRAQAAQLRQSDRAPATLADWQTRRDELRRRLVDAWGPFPAEPAPLAARKLGELQRDGYRLERIVFQTFPNLWMTAHAYVPAVEGRVPAVLCVHGHWAKAKQDPVVQSRCIGLAKLGFFVLAVDACGAGERAIGKALGEYHGEMTGAMLLPIGRSLTGVQIYENMRAIDYLRTRPEVDASRMGVTGASGGGNQSMYLGTFDERVAAVVPVCSVGNYQAYLGAACCMCEVVPGALRFTEEGDVLGLAAPRGLMVISATGDARQFSVREAQRSLLRATEIAKLHDRLDQVRHTIIESGHDYNQPMREAMYGWMTKQLKGQGDGSPIPEPKIVTEEPESIRCFPGESRPDDYVTIPQFARAEAQRLVARRGRPTTSEEWQRELGTDRRKALARSLGLPTSDVGPLQVKRSEMTPEGLQTWKFTSEPGIRLSATQRTSNSADRSIVVLLNIEGEAQAAKSDLARQLRGRNWITMDLRATGNDSVTGDAIGNAPDHNSAEWSLWIGRPLLGQWVHDIRRLLDALDDQADTRGLRVSLIGQGPAGLVALFSAAVDERIQQIECVESLASYVSDEPYRQQRLGTLVPGLLRDVGDVGHVAALIAPRPLTITNPVLGNGKPAPIGRLRQAFEYTRDAYESLDKAGELRLVVTH
jgi:cephalosporin-C deacetylase-like acetyl esterase